MSQADVLQAGDSEDGAPSDDKLKYEQPGALVTLASGIQFREILEGTGKAAAIGDKCSIRCALPPHPVSDVACDRVRQ